MIIINIILILVCICLWLAVDEIVKEVNKINSSRSTIVDYTYRLFSEVSEVSKNAADNFEAIQEESKNIHNKLELLKEQLEKLR